VNEADEILLIHRLKDGREYWVFPGGSIEAGESSEEAVIREVFEETSLTACNVRSVFELENGLRNETYFLVSDYNGKIELGDGPEQERQSSSNYYQPVWVPLKEILSINLQPVEVKFKVLRLWDSSKL